MWNISVELPTEQYIAMLLFVLYTCIFEYKAAIKTKAPLKAYITLVIKVESLSLHGKSLTVILHGYTIGQIYGGNSVVDADDD